VWGSFLRHQVFSFDGVAEFVHSLVYGSSRFTDVHEEVFAGWSDAVEVGGEWQGGVIEGIDTK
jgi:hypothetical protein